MIATPKRLDSSPGATTSAQRTPEELELERKKSALRELESELAELELTLATLHGELAAFQWDYITRVGRLYTQLDDLEAQIADLEFHRKPRDDSARRKAEAARKRARQSKQATDDIEADTPNRRFEPSRTLGRLYRDAARKLHPDLTTDDSDKARRKKLMAEVNQAYEECDEARIRQILDDWQVSPEQVRGEDTAAELVRVIRTIALVEKRWAASRGEIEALQGSDLFKLKTQVQEAAQLGRDLLTEMARGLQERIASAKDILDALLNAEAFA